MKVTVYVVPNTNGVSGGLTETTDAACPPGKIKDIVATTSPGRTHIPRNGRRPIFASAIRTTALPSHAVAIVALGFFLSGRVRSPPGFAAPRLLALAFADAHQSTAGGTAADVQSAADSSALEGRWRPALTGVRNPQMGPTAARKLEDLGTPLVRATSTLRIIRRRVHAGLEAPGTP